MVEPGQPVHRHHITPVEGIFLLEGGPPGAVLFVVMPACAHWERRGIADLGGNALVAPWVEMRRADLADTAAGRGRLRGTRRHLLSAGRRWQERHPGIAPPHDRAPSPQWRAG